MDFHWTHLGFSSPISRDVNKMLRSILPAAFFKSYSLEFSKGQFLVIFIYYFINDLFLWISKSDLHNFADDNTIFWGENTIEKLICTLKKEYQAAMEWFKCNKMKLNPDNFPSVVVIRNSKMGDSYPLFTHGEKINSEKNIKLLGISIDNNLSFFVYVKKEAIN